MKSAPHTSFHGGSKIRVVLTSGKVIITKFIEKTSNRFITTADGKIAAKDISSASYYKPLPHER